MATFNLQVNSSGAWRNVLVRMTKEQIQQVEEHVAAIAAIAGESYKWRVVTPETKWSPTIVISHLLAPDYQWQVPNRARS